MGFRSSLILIFILFLFSVFSSLNKIEIRGPEPKRVIVSMEMDISGDLVNPCIHGRPYYNKPPLFNWVQLVFFRLADSYSETICRLPGILSFILTGFFLFLFTRKLFNENVAVFSVLFFWTSGDLLFYGSVYAGGVDLFLMLITFLQIASVIYYTQKGRLLKMFVFSYFLASLGFLSKGLPSVLIQGISIFTMLILNRKLKALFSWKHLAGIFVFLLPAGSYILIFIRENDLGLFLMNLFSQSIMRYETGSGIGEILKQLIHIPERLLINLLLPWSLLLLFLLNRQIRLSIKQSKGFRIILWMTIANSFYYFLTSEYHHRYLYPFIPFMTILLSFIYEKGKGIEENRIISGVITSLPLLAAVGCISLFFIPDLRYVSHLPVIIITLSAAFGLLFYSGRKKYLKPSFILVFVLLIARTGYNFIYLPFIQDSGKIEYRDISQKITELTNNQPVYLTGRADHLPVSVKMGSFSLLETNRYIESPPVIPGQIPYYITRSSGQIMTYIPEKIPGHFYISRTYETDTLRVKELYRFNDGFWGHDLSLYYYDE